MSISIEPVSVIIPALNEQAYIEHCLDSLLRQEGCNIVEILVVDGGSTDRTIPLVEKMIGAHPQIRLLHNPLRLQGAAVNLGVDQADARAKVFVRADAHTSYDSNFVACCVNALRANDATSVVVAMLTVGKTGFQRAVAAAQNSVMGNGGSAHRIGTRASGFVEHGHHAAFDRAFFQKLSGYDVMFHPNEDFEFDHRALGAGGRIWMTMDAKVCYFPRKTPYALAKQYLYYGRARAVTHMVHRLRPRLRQILPSLLLLMVIGGFALTPVWFGFALPPLAYFTACLLIGIGFAISRRDLWLAAAGPAAIIMHLSYGFGFLQTMLRKLKLTLRPR